MTPVVRGRRGCAPNGTCTHSPSSEVGPPGLFGPKSCPGFGGLICGGHSRLACRKGMRAARGPGLGGGLLGQGKETPTSPLMPVLLSPRRPRFVGD